MVPFKPYGHRCSKMQINGFALVDKNNNVVGANVWQEIPAMFKTPLGDVVAGANVGWTDGIYSIIELSWTVPDPPVIITFTHLMALLTAEERIGLVNSTDPQVKQYLLQAAGAGSINISDQVFINAVNYMVSVNLLTKERSSDILSNRGPS